MPDALDALRTPLTPIAPDPAFASHLRARLERELGPPGGPTVSNILTDSGAVADRLRTGDAGYAVLWVPDVERAARFFSAVLGWKSAPGGSPERRRVTNTTLPHRLWGGQQRSTLLLGYVVDDLEAAIARVRAAGGKVDEPSREPHGRSVTCVDDQGAPFALFEPRPGTQSSRSALTESRHGDIAYITMQVVDSAKARAFYAGVLGWDYAAGRWADGWNVQAPVPMTGMSGGHDRAVIIPVYSVDDITDAVQRTRDAGGTATDPQRQPYGVMSDCADDQGTVFYLMGRL